MTLFPGPGTLRTFLDSILRIEWSGRSRLALLLALSLPLTWGVHEFPFLALEGELYDLRSRLGAPVASDPTPGVTVIAIDEASARAMDDFLPLGPANQARVIERIGLGKPRTIGLILGQEGPSFESDASVHRLHRVLDGIREKGTPILLGTGFDVMGERLPPAPLSALPHAVAILHKDGNVFAEDKVTRRALVRLYGRPTFSTRLAESALETPAHEGTPAGSAALLQERLAASHYRLPQIQADYVFFGYRGNPAVTGGRTSPSRMVDPGVPFRWHTAADLVGGRIPAEDIRDRVVLVGSVNLEDSRDFVATPFSKKPFDTPKLAVHAQIVASLLAGDLVRPVPAPVEVLLTWLLVMGCLLLVSGAATFLVPTTFSRGSAGIPSPGRGAPGPSLVATLVLASAFAASNVLAFVFARIWIPASPPLVAALLSTYLVLPFRLLSEHNARWETEQKNAVLRQVDEMKRNFLSLVTHDLKTPVARIQGLAETLQRRQARVPERRAAETENPELVGHMLDAAGELDRFINSILDLNRIDSQPLRLRIESKDLNRVVEEAIRRHEPLARRRGIRIESALEPLFPVKIDVELISKVLSNLLDNAIKYSGEGRRITVRSLEQDGRAAVVVEDEGVGLSAGEIQRLFARFYRAKNERTTEIAGSGLGLHLTRYFIELHEGSISVESAPGKGSRFRIELPLDGPAGRNEGLTRASRGEGRRNEEKTHA